jgi:hypothetical protein
MEFPQTSIYLRQECLVSGPPASVAKELKYDVCGIISVSYGQRVFDLLVEFYKRSAEDRTHAKLITPFLEGRNNVAAADNLYDSHEKLDTHMASQLMRAVASLSATDAVKRGRGNGTAGSQ